MDHFIYSSYCTDSAVLRTKDPVQALQTGHPNVSGVLAETNSAISKGNRSTFPAVGVNGAAGGPGTETVSKLENGGSEMSGMRNYGVEMGRNPRIFHIYQENCLNDDAFCPGGKFNCTVGLLKPQIRNYSYGDCRPQKQMYLHGATYTPTLLSDDVRSNEHMEVTQMSLQEIAAQSEQFHDQLHGTFNGLKVGRVIKGCAVGLNTIQTTGSIKTELAFPWNQNFPVQKFLQDSDFDENLTPVSGTGGTNMLVGGSQALSLEKHMPSMKICHPAGNVAANLCNVTSWKGKQNNTLRLESLPTSDLGNAAFVNHNKIDTFSSFRGKREILPKSDMGCILSPPVYRSGVFCGNAAVGIWNRSRNFNRAPGSTVYIGSRYSNANQPNKVLGPSAVMNNF
jgi:hypothetical protein